MGVSSSKLKPATDILLYMNLRYIAQATTVLLWENDTPQHSKFVVV